LPVKHEFMRCSNVRFPERAAYPRRSQAPVKQRLNTGLSYLIMLILLNTHTIYINRNGYV